MKNVTELREDLIGVYEQLQVGAIDAKNAAELANIAGKVIKSAAIQLSYNQSIKQPEKKIKFLEGE